MIDKRNRKNKRKDKIKESGTNKDNIDIFVMKKNDKNSEKVYCNNAKKVAEYAAFLALMLIMSYIESQFSFMIPVQGVKIGLCNIVVLAALYMYGARFAFVINMARIFLVGILFGGVYSMIYSFVGGIASFIIMYFAKESNLFSKTGVSISGALVHNMAQIVVAVILLKNIGIALYLPVLIISGVVTGTLIGIAGATVCEKIGTKKFFT